MFISFIFGVLIAFYHFGIEQGFFNESFVCRIKILKPDASANELLQQFENNEPRSCKNVDFKIFGLSLATIDLFISLVLSVTTFKNILKNETNK